jgi:hypothetical protein
MSIWSSGPSRPDPDLAGPRGAARFSATLLGVDRYAPSCMLLLWLVILKQKENGNAEY